MAWSIRWSRRAEKGLGKIDRHAAARIIDGMDEIAASGDPRQKGKALTGPCSGLWRYRMGDYRVICDIVDRELVVLVVAVGHRREVHDR